jgi:hypothetical protein
VWDRLVKMWPFLWFFCRDLPRVYGLRERSMEVGAGRVDDDRGEGSSFCPLGPFGGP